MKNLELPDTNYGKFISIGMFVIFVVFGILGVWSAYAKMDTGVPLPGQVVVQANKKVIQHLEGGIIKQIYVNDGDIVKKGDILVKFSDTRDKASLHSLEANYYEAVALESRLIAENNKKDTIIFLKELNGLNSLKKKKLVKAQLEIFFNNKSSFEKQKQVTRQKTNSLLKQIEGINATIEIKQKLLKSYQDELKDQEDLYAEKLINKVKLREIKRKIDSIFSDILSNKNDIQRIEIKINEANTQLELNQEDFFRKVKNELRKTQTSIDDMKAKMDAIKDRLSRTDLRSPVDGTVLNMRIHTIGAVVGPGKPIMEIVPKNSKLIIEARLSPRYIDYVKVGLKANMTFPAFQLKGRFIKNIEGEVIFVAADSVTDKKGRSSYAIKLVVDKTGKDILKKEGLNLLAGMPASVTIKVGAQTALEYLLKPMTLMVDKAFLEE
jgi:epimerase transport system membrane fusion protein